MLELARYYGEKRARGAGALAAGLTVLVALYVWTFPSVEASGVDLESYVEAFPPALRRAFGIRALGTIEGFLAAELYAFAWVLLLGLYFAYAAASLIAGEVEDGRIDVTLALPVSRSRVVAEKFASLAVPLVAVNVVVPAALVAGLELIGESVSLADLAAVHLLSVPYLLACGSVGLLASVAFDRSSVAQRVAMGAVFGLFLVDSVVTDTEFGWLGLLSPTRYYDPTAVLVEGSYDAVGAGVLLAGTAVLFLASREYFRRTDVT